MMKQFHQTALEMFAAWRCTQWVKVVI